MKRSLSGSTGNQIFDNAIKQIGSAETTFHTLMRESERKCADTWRIVLLNGNPEVIKHFFGDSVTLVDQSIWSEVLEKDLFEIFSECEYKHRVEEAANEFVQSLKLRITF